MEGTKRDRAKTDARSERLDAREMFEPQARGQDENGNIDEPTNDGVKINEAGGDCEATFKYQSSEVGNGHRASMTLVFSKDWMSQLCWFKVRKTGGKRLAA